MSKKGLRVGLVSCSGVSEKNELEFIRRAFQQQQSLDEWKRILFRFSLNKLKLYISIFFKPIVMNDTLDVL